MYDSNGESTAKEAVTTLSLDRVFEVLTERRRRFVLYYLHDTPDGVATISQIVQAVERYEHDVDGEAPDRNAIEVSLTHVHLPKLESAGVLDVDRRTATVRYWRQPSLEEWLEHAFHTELTERA